MPWFELQDQSQLFKEIMDRDRWHVLFKHSPRCGISSMVLRRFENSDLYKEGKEEFWLIDVLRSRSLSDLISSEFGVKHESPQLLLVKDRTLVHSASHSSIDAEQVNEIILNGL